MVTTNTTLNLPLVGRSASVSETGGGRVMLSCRAHPNPSPQGGGAFEITRKWIPAVSVS
jgi:hypothetical protein